MSRQLKGFAAMNTIAENLRGRTAAAREVEFAVNNSKVSNNSNVGIVVVSSGSAFSGIVSGTLIDSNNFGVAIAGAAAAVHRRAQQARAAGVRAAAVPSPWRWRRSYANVLARYYIETP